MPQNTSPKPQWSKQTTLRLVLSGLFLALGYVLPFATGQIQTIGNMLLPMHLPVMMCGLICGWKYGLAVGFLLPPTRSLIFGMPALYPGAVSMAFELATYGLIVGLVYGLTRRRNIGMVYVSLIIAMLSGRVVWGCVQWILLGGVGGHFTWGIFLANGFANALPGIGLQLILIPAIMLTLEKTHLLPQQKSKE